MSMDEFFPRTHKQHAPIHRENPARAQLQRDVEKFLAAGGKIQVVGDRSKSRPLNSTDPI
jgi:hypothetical protein